MIALLDYTQVLAISCISTEIHQAFLQKVKIQKFVAAHNYSPCLPSVWWNMLSVVRHRIPGNPGAAFGEYSYFCSQFLLKLVKDDEIII
jgi:hypothetical protein